MGVFARLRGKKQEEPTEQKPSGFRKESVDMKGGRALDQPTVTLHPNELKAKKTNARFENKYTGQPRQESIPEPKGFTEKIRVRRATKQLKKYKAQQDRQVLVERRVYGRELTAKERADIQRVQKEEQRLKAERQQRTFDMLGGKPQQRQGTYRTRGRGRRSGRRYAYPQAQRDPFAANTVSNADLNGSQNPDFSLNGFLGGGSAPPAARRNRKNDPLNPGGLLY